VGCEQCQPDCVAAATASCPTECQAACVAEARTLGPRYGYRRDLAHNLLRIRNGANELLLENLYGEDVTRPSFDAVTTQQMGPWTVELDYRDLEGESAGLVSAPTSGLGAQYAVSKSSYQPVMICPFGGGYGPWFGIGTRPTRATVVVDSYGVPRTFYYDAQGRSMREVNHATLAAYSYEYDEANRLSASLGPLNRLVCREFVAWDDREQTQTRRYPGWDGNADVLAVYADELIGDKRRLNFTIDESFSRLNYATTTVGDVLTATHPSLGPVLTRTYLGHRLETEKDELTGLHRRYTYDLLGLVRTETVGTGMAAQTWTTWRHASGLVDNRVDPRGNQTFYLWNGGVLDRVTEFSAGRFLVTDLEYDAAQRPFRVTEGQKQTEIGYDALGRAQTVTVRALDGSAPDQVTCVRQGPDGRLIESVSAEGERVRITYDGEGRPTRVEAGALPPSDATWDDACGAPEGTEAGVVAEAHYDAAGRVDLTWSARTGGWTSYAYDGLDRLVKVREPNGLERRFGYDARGLVVWEMAHREGGSPTWPPSETDPRLLSASEHQYDAVGRRTRTDEWHLLNGQRVGDGRETTTWVYEPAKVTITSDSEGQTIVTNDDAGREISRKLATGDVVTTSYGSGDRVTTRGPAPTPTGVLEETILLTPFGAPSERWVGGERVAEWAYDDRLRPFQHTEEWLGRREFAYDGLDRLTGVTHSGVGVANGYESYEWDRSNRLVEHTTPLDATTWIRDALGRVVEETNLHASRTFLYTGTSPNPFQRQEGVLFALDHAHGELKTERGPREARHYERDALGRVTRVWRGAAGSTTPTSDVRMTYDTLSNLASESTNGMTTTHGYNGRRRIRTNTIERTLDPLGRLKSLTLYGTTLGTWTYFGVGGPTTRSGPSGVTTYGYDERGRRVSVQRVAGEQTQTWTKSYDRIARRITTERNGEAPWVATLDGRGRVQSETSNGSERSYDVDEGHNIFRWGGSQAQLLAGDMYASRDGLPVTYDAAGQLTSERGRAYAWTDFGELESVSGLGTSVTYRYDALGRLVTRMPVGAPTETIVWDGWRRVGRSTVDESATLVYGDGLDELLFEYGSWGSGGASAMMQNVGEPCDSVGPGGCDDPPPPPSGGSYEAVIEQDDQGTPVLAENARWTSAEQLTAHGEETVGTPFGTPLGTLSTIGFQGQMRDPLNDLVHMRARWYDPAWGRFLSSDPVGLAGGSNRYAFANGAHALFTDPFGLSPVSPVGHYAGIDPHPAAFADAWQPTRYRFDLVGYHPGVDTGSGPLNFAANGGLGIANLLAGLVNVVSNGTGELEELAVNALADAGFGGDATDVRRQLMIPGAVTQFSRLGSVDDAVIGVRQLVSPGRKSVQRHAFVALGDNSLVFVRGGGPDLAPTNVPGLIPIPRGVRNTTPSPALKGSPYHPKSVAARIRPEYRANPAHNPSSPHFDPRKTPEPSDAASVYQDAKPADIGTWYGRGIGGWYRYFSDNAGGVHFSGIVPESRVPAAILRGH
jgi:RHS repeat-associated protein